MTNKNPFPQQGKRSFRPKEPQKKLLKQRQRLLGDLQAAQEEQARALERFHRAEARLQKRTARVQRVAAQLMLIRQQLSEPAAPPPLSVSMPAAGLETERSHPIEWPPAAAWTGHEEPVIEETLVVVDLGVSETPEAAEEPLQEVSAQETAVQRREQAATPSGPGRAPVSTAEAVDLARKARAAAEAAEEAARQAAERAAATAARLEQVGSGRHLVQELKQVDMEAERTNIIAQEAERAAEEAEMLAHEAGAESQSGKRASQSLPAQAAANEVSEEEVLVEAGAAAMIADVAAAAAAEAGAIAEASSARTQEARRLAQAADQALEEARAAVIGGTLNRVEAERNLRTAQREATRAHALLADAEAAEEQALNAAMDAEAEAEVAEGMAFATHERVEALFDEHLPTVSTMHDGQVEDDETAITLEMPSVNDDED